MNQRLDVMESCDVKVEIKIEARARRVADYKRVRADCVAGATAGAAFLKQMIADRAFYRLGVRVNELIRSGKPIGGFEVGFFTEIARVAGGATALSELHALNIEPHPQATLAAEASLHPHHR